MTKYETLKIIAEGVLRDMTDEEIDTLRRNTIKYIADQLSDRGAALLSAFDKELVEEVLRGTTSPCWRQSPTCPVPSRRCEGREMAYT